MYKLHYRQAYDEQNDSKQQNIVLNSQKCRFVMYKIISHLAYKYENIQADLNEQSHRFIVLYASVFIKQLRLYILMTVEAAQGTVVVVLSEQ